MLAVSQAYRRTNIEGWIAANPWTITVYRRGRTGDDSDTTFEVTGRISPAGTRGTMGVSGTSATAGEQDSVNYLSVLVVAWDSTRIKKGDVISAEHDESGIVIDYNVSFVRKAPHKYEIWLEEIQ